MVTDRIGQIVYANKATATVLGWTPEQLLGRPFTTILPERLRPDYEAQFTRFLVTGDAGTVGRPFRLTALRPDGSEVVVELLITAWPSDSPETSPAAALHTPAPAALHTPAPGALHTPAPGALHTPAPAATHTPASGATAACNGSSAASFPAALGVMRRLVERDDPDRHGHVAGQLLEILADGSSGREMETRLLSRLGQALGWDVTALWHLDPATAQLAHPTVWQDPPGRFDAFRAATEGLILVSGQGLPGRVAASREPAWIADLAQDGSFVRARAAHADGLQSAFAFPVQAKGRLLGVIEMFSLHHREPDDELLEVMASVGRRLGDFFCRAEEARERERLLAELERTRRSREFLLRASRVLAEAADFRGTLERLATLAVPILGDLCLIDILGEDGSLERVVAHHASPKFEHLARQLRDRFSPDPQGHHPSVEVIRTGKSMWSYDMSPDFLRRTTRDEDHLDLVARMGFTSFMSIPLTAAGRVLGSVTLVASGSGRHFSESDLALAEELAQQVAAVIHRARVYDLEHEVARTLQGSLLPDRLPDVPGITVAARYLPSTAGAQVGGDWYDVIPIAPGCVGLVVGDVVGHDVAAASVMGQLRNALRAYALGDQDPGSVLHRLGDFAERLELERMATVLYGVLDLGTGKLALASAGHPPPMVIPHGAAPWFVDLDPGPLLGVEPHVYPNCDVVLGPGDLVVLYTDGLVEDRATSITRGMERLLALAAPLVRDADGVCQALMRPREAGERRSDDVAILAVQRRPPPPA